MRMTVLVVIAMVGCVKSDAVKCEDGVNGPYTCPAGNVCDMAHGLCSSPEALTACMGIDEGMPCSFAGNAGICDRNTCISVFCGDGVRVGVEQCDGMDLGSNASGGPVTCTDLGFYESDVPGPVQCTPNCKYDLTPCHRTCGDHVVDMDGNEACDTEPGAVIKSCQQSGFYSGGNVTCSSCQPSFAACSGFCGDGIANGSELCEPGVSLPAQGCLDLTYDAGRIGCSGACTPSVDECRAIGWKRYVPGAQIELTSIYVAAANDVFVTGGYLIRRFVDGKDVSIPAPSMGNTAALWGTSAMSVWAVGADAQIWHFNGTLWTAETTPTTNEQLLAISGTSSSNIYAAGANGRIVHFNGTSWSAPMTTPDASTINGIWAGATDAFAVGLNAAATGPVVWHLVGTTWTSQTLPGNPTAALQAVWGSSVTDVFAVDNVGGIYHYNGGSWTAQISGTVNWLHAVWGQAADNVYAAGENGTLLHYDGHTWWPVDSNTIERIDALGGTADSAFASGSQGYVARYAGAAYESNVPCPSQRAIAVLLGPTTSDQYVLGMGTLARKIDASFQTILNTSGSFFGIYQSGTHLFVGDNLGTVHHSANGGVNWSPPDTAVTNTFLSAIHGTSPTNVFVGGEGAVIARYDGTVWTIEHQPVVGLHIGGLFASGTDAFAVGFDNFSNGLVWRRDSNTSTWTSETIPGVNNLRSVWGSSATDIYAVGDVGSALHYNGTWSKLTLPSAFDFTAVSGSGANDVWLIGKGSSILHYDGIAWTPVRSPTTDGLDALSVRPERILFGPDTSLPFALARSPGW